MKTHRFKVLLAALIVTISLHSPVFGATLVKLVPGSEKLDELGQLVSARLVGTQSILIGKNRVRVFGDAEFYPDGTLKRVQYRSGRMEIGGQSVKVGEDPNRNQVLTLHPDGQLETISLATPLGVKIDHQ